MPESSINYLGFGTAGITSLPSRRAAIRLLRTAFDAGIRHFDTAPLYGKGYAEQLLGDFAVGRRPAITITTKFGLGESGALPLPAFLALPLNYYRKKWKGAAAPGTGEPAGSGQSVQGAPGQGSHAGPGQGAGPEAHPLPYRKIDRASIEKSLAASLQRLRTDYIDYYFLHEGLPGFLDPDALEFLLDRKQKGVIRRLGVATDGFNLGSLGPRDLDGWDVLQYEAGEWQAPLRKRYPDKLHFVHSVLKHFDRQAAEPGVAGGTGGAGVAAEASAGRMLAAQKKTGLADKLLFSTRQRPRLQQNIAGFIIGSC
ncbi:MAG TPA: aldo/keto reductase [Puia sp.]|nr:aldo/keto reductase [Puia sp.]